MDEAIVQEKNHQENMQYRKKLKQRAANHLHLTFQMIGFLST